MVHVSQQHALTQGPRTDLEFLEVEQVHRGLGDDGAGPHLVRPIHRDARQCGDLVVAQGRQLAHRRYQVGAFSVRRT